jgi:hypothetical protein
VIIATRNRPHDLRRVLESLTQQTFTDFKVLVVDQSDDVTENGSMIAALGDDRFHHIPTATRGKSRALNEALLSHSSATRLVFTDDDCDMLPSWLDTVCDAFHRHPSAGIIFGSLVPIPHDPSEVFVPGIEFNEERVFDAPLLRSHGLLGMGANMAIPRTTFEQVGLFDNDLGPGGVLFTGEECELMYRCSGSGLSIVQEPSVTVRHWGIRPWTGGAAARILADGYYATMAGHGKHVRAGDWRAMLITMHEVLWQVGIIVNSVLRRRRPFHIKRLATLANGFFAGLRRGPAWPVLDDVTRSGDGASQTARTPRAGTPACHKLRITFITEQHVGLKTYSDNLRRFAGLDPRIDATWTPVTYVDPHGLWERMKFLPEGIRGSLRGRAQVRRGIKETQPDVCLFLTQVPAALGGRTARRQPYVVIADDTPALFDGMAEHYGARTTEPAVVQRIKHRINVRALRTATVVLPMSEWARSSLVRDYGVLPDRAIVLPTGIDLERWHPIAKTQHETLRILFVGGHFDRKGGNVLLRAFEGLTPGSAELHVVTRSEVEAQPGVFVYRDMQPNTPELIDLFQRADVFVLPSRAEAFPNVVIEASAVGLPCIVTDVGAMSEMVVDNETGFVFQPDDAERLRSLLRRLIDEPERRTLMGTAARRRAEQLYDGRTNARRVVDLLLAAASRR